jgi:hypothetical protein
MPEAENAEKSGFGVVFPAGDAKLESMMKNSIFQRQRGDHRARWVKCGLLAAGAAGAILLAAAAAAKPVIVHDPVQVAVKGEPLGLRATVRDAGGRVSSVSVFYASSRGMTPFRRDLSTTGAGIWFGTIPGHLIGPGSNLFYYVHADNLEGESTDTEWVSVKVIEPGMPAEAIPSATSVAQQSQRAASGAAASKPAPAGASRPGAAGAAKPGAAAAKSGTGAADKAAAEDAGPAPASKYWVPAAIIVGGAAAIGGGIALANRDKGGDDDGGSGGGGGGGTAAGGDGTTVTNGNYGGSYNVCFGPSGAESNTVTTCDSGPVNVYVENGSVQVVGLWGGEVLTGTMIGSSFTAVGDVSARLDFPPAHLIVSGSAGSTSCSAQVDGYSTDTEHPGNFTGSLSTTLR